MDITALRGESWKARASEAKGRIQALRVETIATGVARVAAYKAETHCPRWERVVP